MILPFHSHRNPIHKRQWITLSISFGRCCCHLIKFKWKKASNTLICSELQNNLVWDTTFKISSLSCWTMALNLGFCFSVSLMISITLSAICIGVTVCDLWQENKFNCKCKWEFVPYVQNLNQANANLNNIQFTCIPLWGLEWLQTWRKILLVFQC